MLNYGPHPEPRSIRVFLFVQSGNARPSSLYKTPVPPKSCEQISSRKYDTKKKIPRHLGCGPCRFEIECPCGLLPCEPPPPPREPPPPLPCEPPPPLLPWEPPPPPLLREPPPAPLHP